MNASFQSIAAALDTLRANPLRTVLSTLGVIIGVGSLVAILALSDGLERYSRNEINATTDLQRIVVSPRAFETRDGVRVARERVIDVTRADVSLLRSELGETADVALTLVGSGLATLEGDTARRAVLLIATDEGALAQMREGLVAGRFLSAADVERGSRVVVVPRSYAESTDLSPERLLGRRLEVSGERYAVIGVDGRSGSDPLALVIPLGDAVRGELEGPDRRAEMVVHARRVEDVEAVLERIRGWLEARYGDASAFTIASYKARAAQARQAMLVFKLVMGAIAGISLLVGGIGIMNILLASVFERTREIGIRKAAGARPRHILLQFLAESVAITGLGAVLGVAVGLVGAFAIAAVIRSWTEAPLYAVSTWSSMGVAAVAALVVGLVFGTYPARRAAKLSPIDAIRNE